MRGPTAPAPAPLPVSLSLDPAQHPGPTTGFPGPQTSKIFQLSISGLASGKPHLFFKVSGHPGAPPIKSLTLELPGGLHFARTLKDVRSG